MGKRKSGAKTRTTVVVVQDKSGSMSDRVAATLSGYNEYIQDLQKTEGDIRVTLTQFDTHVNNVYTAKPVNDVKELTQRDYVPGGMTALYDAVGRAVRETELAVGKGERVMVIIMTDGKENSSGEFNHQAILDTLERKRKDGWEFIFLGAGEEAWNTGNSLGFDVHNSVFYTGDAHDHQVSYRSLSGVTANYAAGATGEKLYSPFIVAKSHIDTRATTGSTPEPWIPAKKTKNPVKS